MLVGPEMISVVHLAGPAAVSFDDRTGVLAWLVVAAAVVAVGLAGARWLRVAQREHYLAGSVARFAVRWWAGSVPNRAALLVAVVGLLLTGRWPVAGLATAAVVAVGPLGLSLKGRSAPLVWTRRLRTLAAVSVVIEAVIVVIGAVVGDPSLAAVAGAAAVAVVVDLACAITAPFERRAAGRYVAAATERIRRVAPKVVAITGSYGKTTTKGYVAHLLSASMTTVASPGSFNNRAGLSRAVNEHVAPGTEVFVAEMGTYGRGEIAELCDWLVPDVSVITAIGPVHLERFGSEERVVEAKAEILDKAPCVVLVIDDPRLAALADRSEASGKRVWRVSDIDDGADVAVLEQPDGLSVTVRGRPLARGVDVPARPANAAAAVAVAMELGVPEADIVTRLSSLPGASHRLEVATAPSGAVVLDDTYNSNPAGARVALDALRKLSQEGRRVVVTPGMVELGRRQSEENARFAEEAARAATDLIVVGRTNRRSLLVGAGRAATGATERDKVARTLTFATRDGAVSWVRENLGAGDAVLYENDLPDHYP